MVTHNQKGQKMSKETIGIENKQEMLRSINRHCEVYSQRKYYTVGSEVEDGIIKFFIRNNDNHKVFLYATSLKDLIKTLKILQKHLESEPTKPKEEKTCRQKNQIK